MTISGYFQEHWAMLVLLLGMGIVLYSDIYLERRMIHRIFSANIMMFIYSITCYAETYLGNQTEYTVFRPILSAFNYSLIVFIIVMIVMILFPNQKLYLFFPAVMNAVLCFISVPTGIVFTISEDNHFFRGTLGYLTYFISGLYLLYLIYNLFRHSKVQKEDFILILYISLTSILCLVFPLFEVDTTSHWFNMTIAVNVMLYYVFLLQKFTKHDPLTNLLNRQSYYSDAERYSNHITAVVAMDMNGLKEINDNEGHKAGDTALQALADCFWKAANHGQRIYRIGGDEFTILCIGILENDVLSLIERIRQEVAKTAYTCSIGYAMKTEGSTIDTLYQTADSMLYEDKKKFYESMGRDRRKRRT